MKTPFLVSRPWDLLLAGIIALVLAFPYGEARAESEDDEDESAEVVELDEEDLACLKCHDDPTLEAKLDSGETLSLHISTKDFLGSMHNENSCADCHYEIDIDDHGQGQSTITSKRELGVSMAEACLDCHKKSYRQYNDSVHGLLFEQGNEKAPLCADCHNPHTVKSWEDTPAEAAVPCGKCHQAIFKASAKDVHGLAQADEETKAPVCSGCHQAHGIKAASLGSGIRDTCLDCHEDAAAKHKVWLPNTELHFDTISCPVCHAPDADRRVNLRLYHEIGKDRQQILEKSGVPQFIKRAEAADKTAGGLDDRELLGLLKLYSREGSEGKTVLRGRLEVSSGVQAHQLAEKEKAIGDCKLCHQAGAEPFKDVILTVAGADGRPISHDVNKKVLSSLFSIDSVKGFYVLGSTRIKMFDYLLVLVVAGLAGGVLLHAVARWLFRRARQKREAELRRDGDSQ